ncbi:MAG: hypothetical protein JRJ85_12650 [Deltaproteobacteria bacterium]|nr:hypothetical protein [Deltaproteobacteria bacterium]
MLKNALLEFSVEGFIERTVSLIVEQFDRRGFLGTVFGASGGIDSLVTASLCLRAGCKVVGLQMNDSRIKGEIYNPDLFRDLGVDLIEMDLTREAVESEKRLGMPPRWLSINVMKLALRGLPPGIRRRFILAIMDRKVPDRVFNHYRLLTLLHRLRISRLREYAADRKLMVVICANLTEILLGYFVEQGVDDPEMGDLSPLARLYKTRVISTARFLGLPEGIIRQRPSPGFGGVRDDDIIGPYESVDRILIGLNMGYSDNKIARLMGPMTHMPEHRRLFGRKNVRDIHHIRFIRQLVQNHSRKTDAF